jgi:D-sedoheptulose 7-phosphate isomerase
MLTTDLVNQFRNQSILVTGDTYAEREFYGEVSRLAPEAPVPVVKIKSKRLIPGGAANVARNIATLGGKSLLYCGFGQDEAAKEILKGLLSDGVGITISSGSASTRLPERYRIFAASQQLLQILRMPCVDDGPSDLPSLTSFLAGQAEKVGAVVIYDQGYGFVTQDLLREVEHLAQADKIRVVVDARPDHVGWYGRAALYTFNAEESLAAAKQLGSPANSVIEAGTLLKKILDSPVLVTEGGEGMTVFPMEQEPQKIPANRVPIADRAGAGDSVTAVLALSLAAGADLRQAAELANKAAGIVVAKPGIAYVRPEELLNLFHEEISHLLLESAEVKHRLVREQLPVIESVVRAIIRTYRKAKTVYAFGNGGSAADANHFITELVGRFMIERKALPAVSFSANEILMTSIANDYGYENTFARQVEAFVKEGDLAVAFSTSGKSKNVLKALELAKRIGATTVGFTGGGGGEFPQLCDICIRVPSEVTPRIQESHVVVVHIICELLEKELALPGQTPCLL